MALMQDALIPGMSLSQQPPRKQISCAADNQDGTQEIAEHNHQHDYGNSNDATHDSTGRNTVPLR